jgi:hypothetical protein
MASSPRHQVDIHVDDNSSIAEYQAVAEDGLEVS